MSDTVLRMQHLMDQLEGAAMAVVHAQASTDPVIRATLHQHTATYHRLADEFTALANEHPEALPHLFDVVVVIERDQFDTGPTDE